jgi:hypothetical protein
VIHTYSVYLVEDVMPNVTRKVKNHFSSSNNIKSSKAAMV